MFSKNNKSNKWYLYFLNKYVLVGIIFIVWMLFFDQNSYLLHKELDNDIQKLTEEKEYFTSQLQKESDALDELNNNPESYEKLAREKYWMKKPNEEIFIIEIPDSTKNE